MVQPLTIFSKRRNRSSFSVEMMPLGKILFYPVKTKPKHTSRLATHAGGHSTTSWVQMMRILGEHEVYLISAYFKVQSNVTSRTAPVSRKAGSLLAMTDYVIILRCGMVYEFNEYIDIGCRVKASLLITLR